MKLLLQRSPSLNAATLGELSVDGAHECFTLEDEIRERDGVDVSEWKVAGTTAIPAGTYRVVIDFSQKLNAQLPHLINVPGFTGIRIHIGNKAIETEGCILVGQAKGPASVLRSTVALKGLQPKIQAALDRGEKVEITIVNPV
jgi:hypothetical protein